MKIWHCILAIIIFAGSIAMAMGLSTNNMVYLVPGCIVTIIGLLIVVKLLMVDERLGE